MSIRTLQVRVKPNSKVAALEEQDDGTWVARVQAPPVDGKANQALIELIARHFAVPKSRVSIRQGASGRIKRIEIDE